MREPAPSWRWWPEVSPSTASVHLNRLKTEHLVKVLVQGKHRYYSLEGPEVARALEGLQRPCRRISRQLRAQARQAGYAPRELATITWRARWACLSTTVLGAWGGFRQFDGRATMPMTSRLVEQKRLRLLALI